ncbi:MAG: secretin N-terminal domain-containing protein [Bacteroidales bacterium]|nr:secretin N-terminal domain-containing protein [Bacteroidales bacterium]
MVVRTFTILAAPGRVAFESQVSNKSKERSSSSSFSGNVNSTQQTGDASAQTTQIHKTKFDVDVWREVKENCEKLLSRDGKVVLDQAAGTVTVRDRYVRVRDIASYIDQLNERLSRQVAVTVRVWSLELDDNNDVGLNLQALFEAGDTSVVSGSLSSLGGAGTAAVSVVKGRLKGSSGTIKALKEWGKATQLTSGGGLLVNNQPLPIQAVQRHAYIAGMTLATSEYNQTSEITPGEVSTGFSMTIVPHILKDRRVILQYNLTMSSLENMKEVDRDSVYVQLPETYTRSFSQRSRMKMGETLVLAGFEQTRQVNSNSVGILSTGRNTEYGRTLIIVTIELESAESV